MSILDVSVNSGVKAVQAAGQAEVKAVLTVWQRICGYFARILAAIEGK